MNARILLALVSATMTMVTTAPLTAAAEVDVPRLRHVTVGFNSQVRNRFWAPCRITIENPGPARTFVVVAEARGVVSGQQTRFERTVTMAAHSSRSLDFPVLPDMRVDVDPAASQILPVCRVKLTDGQAYTWSEMEAFGRVLPEESFGLLVSDGRSSSYTCLKNETIGSTRRPIMRFVLPPAELPRRPLYYQGVETVILSDLGQAVLTPLQQRALGEWVRSGGHLILGPGTVLPDGQLADLLPVRYLSVRAVETLPLIAPGVQFPGRVGFGRMLLTGNHDAIVLGDATRPVAVRRREGLGWVTAVAMDLGSQELQRWEGSAALLKSLVAVPRLHHWADRLLERSESVEGMLSSLAGIKVLSRRALLVYVTAVVGVVLVILLVFRLTRLPEWGWALATLVAVGGGCAAVAVANSYKAQPSPFLAELGMVTGCQADRSAVVQAMIGLFSPTEATYRVTATDDFVSLRPGPSRLTPPERFVATYEAQSSLPDLRVRADGIRLMNGRGFINAAHPPDPVVDLPRAVVRAGPAGLAIEIENPTAYRLDDVFLKYHRFVLPLGDLPAGARRVASGLQRGTGSFTSRLVRNPADELRERLRQVFFPAPVFSLERVFSFNERRFQAYFRGQEPRPVLYAWTDHLPALLAVDPPLARRAVGLWAIETDLVFDGERYLVPRGVLDLRLGSRAGATNRAGDGQFFGTRPAELEIDFVLPAGWPDLVIDQARVSLEFRGSAFRPQIALRPVGGGSAVVLTGDPPYTIPEPARFYDQTTRSLRLVLRVESGVSGSRMAETAMLGLTNWQVREVDVELEGTVQ